MAMWTRAVPLQAVMGGSQEATLGTIVGEGDIFVSFTGNFKTITLDLMKKMRNNAIVGNIEHFDNKIDMTGSRASQALRVRTLGRKWTALHSPMVTASSCLHPGACATWAAPQASLFRHVLFVHQSSLGTD